jgi:hypothetical protein
MEQVWFQQDSAPAYFTLTVHEFLIEAFTGHCIGCGFCSIPFATAMASMQSQL